VTSLMGYAETKAEREALEQYDYAQWQAKQDADEFCAMKLRIAELEAALRRALTIIDSPHYRDAAGVRPSAHPAVDEMRELLAN
jgi:hypothetical protein